MSKTTEEINKEFSEAVEEDEIEPEYNHEKTIEDRWLDNKLN